MPIGEILPIIQLATAGAGLGGNIMSSIQQGDVASQAAKNAKLTPGQLGTMVSGAEQPLDRSLINTVNNQVQADMASRGLAEAPGIFGATEAQALAPYQQQNQQTALQLILEKLGLPASTLQALRSGGGGMANLSPLLQSLMKAFPQQTNQVPDTSNIPSPVPGILMDIINQNQNTGGGLTTPNNWTGSTDTSGGTATG